MRLVARGRRSIGLTIASAVVAGSAALGGSAVASESVADGGVAVQGIAVRAVGAHGVAGRAVGAQGVAGRAVGGGVLAGGPSPAEVTQTVIAAGDIASCGWETDAATAELVESMPGIVMTAGDNAYPSGTYGQFRDCYGPTWGRFIERTRPTPGNHDWYTDGAAGYFRYFGDRAGPAGRGYYAFRAGSWLVYALSGDCVAVGGCWNGSPQHTWLKEHLAAHPRRCVLAVWHQPRFSSGPHGENTKVAPLLRVLYRAGAEIVVNGHDHLYERFVPGRPDGTADPLHGIRRFTVGTAGAPLYAPEEPFARGSEVRDATSHGVLELTLGSDGYGWRFVPVAGGTFTDAGTGVCHAPPA
jgi:acid phosphatase type 7